MVHVGRELIYESLVPVFIFSWGKISHTVWKRPLKHLQSNLQSGDLNFDPGTQCLWMKACLGCEGEVGAGLWRLGWMERCEGYFSQTRQFAESHMAFIHLEMGQVPCGSGHALWSPYVVGAKWSSQTYSHAPWARGGQQLLWKCALGDWADQHASRP